MEQEYNIFSHDDFVKKDSQFSVTSDNIPVKQHRHSFWEFFLLEQGSISHTFNEEPANKISEGTIILIKPNDSHSINLVKGHRITDLYANNNEFQNICALFGENVYQSFIHTNTLMSITPDKKTLEYIKDKLSLIQYYQKINESQTIFFVYIPLLTELISLFWDTHINIINTEQQKFYTFLAKMNTPEYICAPLDEIVKISGYSHSHFCKIFKQNTKKTLKDYHTQLKMEYAISLLSNPNLSLLEISNLLGYSSLSHFIKIFKTHTSYTPKQYRKQLTLNKNRLINTNTSSQ